jgi:hypothetical protein
MQREEDEGENGRRGEWETKRLIDEKTCKTCKTARQLMYYRRCIIGDVL